MQRFFLCLFAGQGDSNTLPRALDGLPSSADGTSTATFVKARATRKQRKPRKGLKTLDWVIEKKERQKERGKKVCLFVFHLFTFHHENYLL